MSESEVGEGQKKKGDKRKKHQRRNKGDVRHAGAERQLGGTPGVTVSIKVKGLIDGKNKLNRKTLPRAERRGGGGGGPPPGFPAGWGGKRRRGTTHRKKKNYQERRSQPSSVGGQGTNEPHTDLCTSYKHNEENLRRTRYPQGTGTQKPMFPPRKARPCAARSANLNTGVEGKVLRKKPREARKKGKSEGPAEKSRPTLLSHGGRS